MITSKITNIVLNKNRFNVFVSFSNGIEETNVFMPETTSNDILVWLESRVSFYNDLENKEIQLNTELKEKEYNLQIFDELYIKDADFKSKIDGIKGIITEPIDIEPIIK